VPDGPSPEELRAADYGPSPTNYQEAIRTHYAQWLFDPYSAVYTFGTPGTGWVRPGPTASPVYGWRVCGTVNAKNRFGGYVGARPFVIVIRHDQVATDIMGDTDFTGAIVQGACR
jgi:hypothetical protein